MGENELRPKAAMERIYGGSDLRELSQQVQRRNVIEARARAEMKDEQGEWLLGFDPSGPLDPFAN